MNYKVKASLLPGKAVELYKILTGGTVQSQKPDGTEIVASMKRAKITDANIIEWYELCYCPTPLAHERNTVYDRYFENISTQLVEEFGEIKGESFWEFLEAEARSSR